MILPLDHFQASMLIFLSLFDHSSLCSIHLNLHLAGSSHILTPILAFQETLLRSDIKIYNFIFCTLLNSLAFINTGLSAPLRPETQV